MTSSLDPTDSSMPSTQLCQTCNSQSFKYRCPRCDHRSCSVACLKTHKSDSQCSGEKQAQSSRYVAPNEYGWGELMRDWSWLEGMGRRVEQIGKQVAEMEKVGQKRLGGNHKRNNGRNTNSNRRGNRGRANQGTDRQPDFMQDLGMKSWDADLTPREKSAMNKARSQGIKIMKLPNGMARRNSNMSTWDNRKQTLFLSLSFELDSSVVELSSTDPDPKRGDIKSQNLTVGRAATSFPFLAHLISVLKSDADRKERFEKKKYAQKGKQKQKQQSHHSDEHEMVDSSAQVAPAPNDSLAQVLLHCLSEDGSVDVEAVLNVLSEAPSPPSKKQSKSHSGSIKGKGPGAGETEMDAGLEEKEVDDAVDDKEGGNANDELAEGEEETESPIERPTKRRKVQEEPSAAKTSLSFVSSDKLSSLLFAILVPIPAQPILYRPKSQAERVEDKTTSDTRTPLPQEGDKPIRIKVGGLAGGRGRGRGRGDGRIRGRGAVGSHQGGRSGGPPLGEGLYASEQTHLPPFPQVGQSAHFHPTVTMPQQLPSNLPRNPNQWGSGVGYQNFQQQAPFPSALPQTGFRFNAGPHFPFQPAVQPPFQSMVGGGMWNPASPSSNPEQSYSANGAPRFEAAPSNGNGTATSSAPLTQISDETKLAIGPEQHGRAAFPSSSPRRRFHLIHPISWVQPLSECLNGMSFVEFPGFLIVSKDKIEREVKDERWEIVDQSENNQDEKDKLDLRQQLPDNEEEEGEEVEVTPDALKMLANLYVQSDEEDEEHAE